MLVWINYLQISSSFLNFFKSYSWNQAENSHQMRQSENTLFSIFRKKAGIQSLGKNCSLIWVNPGLELRYFCIQQKQTPWLNWEFIGHGRRRGGLFSQVPKTSVNLDGDVRKKFMCHPSILTQGSREWWVSQIFTSRILHSGPNFRWTDFLY